MLEIRSVNHKFCDVRTRLPRMIAALEGPIQSHVRSRVSRGRVDVTIESTYVPEASPQPVINLALARGYMAAYNRIRSELDIEAPVSLELIAAAPGVVEAPQSTASLEELGALVMRALDDAIAGLISMRQREGQELENELNRLLEDVDGFIRAIVEEVPEANRHRKQRMEQKMREHLDVNHADPVRIAQEIAILADRSDVTEEVARLESHSQQFRRMLTSEHTVGRKLDFLLQEMHRETNTIGSKSASSRISHLVVDLKSAIERMREQVQNVE